MVMDASSGWVGPTIAISMVIVALAFIAIAGAAVLLSRALGAELKGLSREVAELRSELAPALRSLQRVAATGEGLVDEVKDEVRALVTTSREVRQGLERGVRRVRTRLSDLDALYEVVQGEVEETALDVAASLRTFRRGAGMVNRLRRMVVRSRR